MEIKEVLPAWEAKVRLLHQLLPFPRPGVSQVDLMGLISGGQPSMITRLGLERIKPILSDED
jgi:hypothetical protein